VNDLVLVGAGLGRKKVRTALLMLSVAIAITVFAVLAAFQSAVSGSVGGTQGDRLMAANRISFTQNLPFAHVERIGAVEGVADVSYSQYVGAYFREPRNFLLAFAVEPESWLRIHPELVAPPDQLAAFQAQRDGAMVGRSIAERFGWSVGDQIPISSHMWTRADGARTWPVILRAIYDGAGEGASTEQMFIHYDYLDAGRTSDKGEISYVHIMPTSRDTVSQVAASVDALFANSAAETRTTSEQGFYAAFVEQQGSIGLMVVSVAAAGLFTCLLIVANAVMRSIRERAGEFAVMRAIGFTPGRIARAVLGETAAIVLAGGVAGLVAAYLIIGYARGFGMFFSTMTLAPGVVASAIGLMALLALSTGLGPAWVAMRVSVASAFGRGAS
jgi:putative ABC transport system permease protein